MADHQTILRVLTVLEKLRVEEFKVFKWHLKNLEEIPLYKLECATRHETVDLMVQHYPQEVVQVTTKCLSSMKRDDLVLALNPPKDQDIFGVRRKEKTSNATGKEKPDNRDIYPVSKDSMRSRVALLITNIKFTDEEMNRNGAEKDEENMENLLKSLKYEVVKHSNLTGKEIDRSLVEFSKHPKLIQTDSVVVVIMSHGKLGAILGKDWTDENQDEFPINNIYKHLDSHNCPALLDKPKIIIIQACRGGGTGSVLVSDGPNTAEVCDEEENIEEDRVQHVHKEKNFIALHSCTPDTAAYRHKDLGSFFIRYIDDVFKSSARQHHIEELFRKVMLRFEDFKFQTRRQMPTKERCTLTRNFYFFPAS